jgi:hypothetical protein
MGWVWAILWYFSLLFMTTVGWAAAVQFGKARKAEADAERLQIQAIECAELLRHIAVTSFLNNHTGTFQAWAERMGRINVKVESMMHRVEEDTDSVQI